MREPQQRGPGHVTVHFLHKSLSKFPNQGNNASDSDLVIQIPSDGCMPDSVKVNVPRNTVGVIEQKVEITYQSAHGRKSNVWNATFKPTMVMQQLSTVVQQCTQSTSIDLCNPGPGSYGGGGTCAPDALGDPTAGANSIQGFHFSCAIAGSDNGEDFYAASVTAAWTITQVVDVQDTPPLIAGASGTVGQDTTMEFDYVPQPLPHSGTVTVNVNWNIGPSGNILYYAFNVYAKGPAGVPAQ